MPQDHPALKKKVLPPSEFGDRDSPVPMVDRLVSWFLGNYALPHDVITGDLVNRKLIWPTGLGPFSPQRVLQDLSERYPNTFFAADLENAGREIKRRFKVDKWTAAHWRVVDPDPTSVEMRGQLVALGCDPKGTTIVETILYPTRDMRWTVHATFVPGDINELLGKELKGLTVEEGFRATVKRYASIREIVKALHREEIRDKSADNLDRAISKASVDWIEGLESDRELFVQTSIIIHHSPPAWIDLDRLAPAGDGAVISAVLLTAPTLAQAAIVMLAYGGSRIFLRLVKNLNYTQDALFERVQRRIRRSDWKPDRMDDTEPPKLKRKRRRPKHRRGTKAT